MADGGATFTVQILLASSGTAAGMREVESAVSSFSGKATQAHGEAGKLADVLVRMKTGASELQETMLRLGESFLIFKAFEAAVEAEQSLAKLTAVLHSTRDASKEVAEALDAQAAALSRNSTYSKEAVVNAEALLATFTHIGGEVFPLVTKTAMDMAAVTGQDLASAITNLGRVLDDPIRGMQLLRREHVTLSEAQQESIRNFMAQGEVAKAQGVILDALVQKYGGAAAAMRDTMGGALSALKNAVQEVLAKMGEDTTGPFRQIVEHMVSGLHYVADNWYDILAAADEVMLGIVDRAKKMVDTLLSLAMKMGETQIKFMRLDPLVNEADVQRVQDTVIAIGRARASVDNFLTTAHNDLFVAMTHNIHQQGEEWQRLSEQIKLPSQGLTEEDKAAQDAAAAELKRFTERHAAAALDIADRQAMLGAANAEVQFVLGTDEPALRAHAAALLAVTRARETDLAVLAAVKDLSVEHATVIENETRADLALKFALEDRQKVLEREKVLLAEVTKEVEARTKAERDFLELQSKVGPVATMLDQAKLANSVELMNAYAAGGERAYLAAQLEQNARALGVDLLDSEALKQADILIAQQKLDAEIAQFGPGESYKQAAAVFNQLSTEMGGSSTQAGKLTAELAKVATALSVIKSNATAADKALALSSGIASIGTMLQQLNIGASNKPGGTSALGGAMESNYAATGAIVGTVIGAVVAAIFSYGAGATGGAALGGAIGTVLGSMISHAGDSASGQLMQSGNVIVQETSQKLNGAVHDALINIFKGLNSELASLGMQMGDMGFISLKIRDNIVQVWVGAMERTFSSVQDAVSWAISQAVIQNAGKGGHLPPEVLAALAHTTATDLSALQSDIAFAQGIANFGVPKVVQAIDKAVSDFFVAMNRAAELGIDSTKVIAQFVATIQTQKDSILGVNRNLSPQDQMRADTAAFNAKVALLKAQEQVDLADLQVKKADLQAQIALAQGEVALAHGRIAIQGEVDQAAISSLQTLQAALDATNVASAAAQAIIDGLVTISDQELADALARIGKGSGGAGRGSGGGSGTTSLQQLIDSQASAHSQIGMSDFQKQLADINKKWADATAAVHLHSNALDEAKKAHDAAIKAANGNADAIKKANEKYQEQIAHIHKTSEELDRANASRLQEIADLVAQNQAAVQASVDDAIGKNDAFSQVHKKFADLAKAVVDAGFSATVTAQDLAALGLAEAQQIQTLADQMNVDLLGNIAGYVTDAVEKQKILNAQAQLKYEIDMATWAVEIEKLKAEGKATQALLDAWKYLQDNPPTFDINVTSTGTTPGGDGQGGHWVPNGHGGWTWVPDAGSGASAADSARNLLQQYQERQKSPLQQSLDKINADFATISAALGNTAEVIQARNAAIQQAVDQFLQPLQQLKDSMAFAPTSTLTGAQQFMEAQSRARTLMQQIQSGDISNAGDAASILQQYLQQGQQYTAGSGYQFISKEITDDINKIMQLVPGFAMGQAAPSGASTAPMFMEAPKVVAAIDNQSNAMVAGQQDASAKLGSIDASLGGILVKLDSPWSVRLVA